MTVVSRCRIGLTFAITTALCAAAGAAFATEPQSVVFTGRDGVEVTGSLYLPDRQPAPAVVLLPMMGRSRADWDVTAQKLAEAGIAALAIDFRRNGGPRLGADGAESGDYSDLVIDGDAARAYLASRPDVSAGRIGLLGASIGACVAVLSAASDPQVRSLALLSPSLEYRGIRIEQPLRKYASRPALLVVSSEDPYALRSARAMVSMGDGARELRVLSGAGHGTIMLSREPDLSSVLVDWFLRTLL